ncbi:MAG: TonB C-terminal domain-containing protein [Nitrospinota bacterium]
MRVQLPQSLDFNQMLVLSVFVHLAIITFTLFLPKPSAPDKPIVPAFMVNLVELPTGNKPAAKKRPAKEKKSPAKKRKPVKAKKKAVKKKVVKKEVVKKAPPPKKVPPPKPSKILKALKQLDKKAAAVAPLPAKKMIEELDQLAMLDRKKKPVAKPKTDKPILEETFRELEKLKEKKINPEKVISSKPVAENLLEDFEELKMEEVVEQKEVIKSPDLKEETKAVEPVVEKRNLLEELEKLAKLDTPTQEDKKNQAVETKVSGKESKAYDSVLEKFESISVESSRVKVEVEDAKFEESKFQSKLRLPDTPEKAESKNTDESYVTTDQEGTPGADVQSLYAGLVQEKIYKNWRDPLAERHSKEAVISFHIFPKGNIDKPFIKQSSGVEVLDTLAVGAVLDSVPFPPFPKELKKSNLFLSIYFKYVPKDD